MVKYKKKEVATIILLGAILFFMGMAMGSAMEKDRTVSYCSNSPNMVAIYGKIYKCKEYIDGLQRD